MEGSSVTFWEELVGSENAHLRRRNKNGPNFEHLKNRIVSSVAYLQPVIFSGSCSGQRFHSLHFCIYSDDHKLFSCATVMNSMH